MMRPPTAEKAMVQQGERHRIAEVLDSMSETLRVPLLLRDMDEFSYEEVAAVMGIGLSAAKMRIKRAREEFRKKYLESEEPMASMRDAAS
jgi:RNA polymerase sigma-70 factor (ECF subfamily)